MTAPDREQQIANRELGTIEAIETGGRLGLRLDSGTRISLSVKAHPHLDYAVTSHSSQGQTADRVLVHVDTARRRTTRESTLGLCGGLARPI